ncbi:hypothetical protein [Frankia sp. QA3]|uniref:hypothetical protein n=1 Tax=Frankia sp. QA3 TaxID=710111 RepID=UPI000269BB6C|nr:hypothetical protein [Frankia sp. QA3]EIV92627.1 ATP-dependent transcriptional regulator [Frankia sp. QA3]
MSVSGPAGAFTDRTVEIGYFRRLLDPADDLQVLVFFGGPLIGKSALLVHLSDLVQRRLMVDLTDPTYNRSDDDPALRLLEVLADQIERQAGRPLSRYRHQRSVRPKAERLPRISVRSRVIALFGGRIERSPLSIVVGSNEFLFHVRRLRRERMTQAFSADLAELRLPETCVFFDVAERMSRFDGPVPRETREPDAGDWGGFRLSGHWLSTDLLRCLLLADVKVVFAGQGDVALPREVRALHAAVEPWRSGDTAAFLSSRRLGPVDIRQVAATSQGIPGWAAALADLVQGSGRPLRIEDLEERTPEGIWTGLLSEHIPVRLRQAIYAAAVPRRIVHDELLRTLLEVLAEESGAPTAGRVGRSMSDAELQRTRDALRSLSFVQRSPSGDATGEPAWYVHSMIRGSVLNHLRGQPAWDALHRAAAEYFARTGSFDAELYHRFACNDFQRSDEWLARLDAAYRGGDIQEALLLVDAVLAPEQRGGLRRHRPALLQAGYQYGADLARIQGRIDDAHRFASSAQSMARLRADHRALGRSLLETATRTMRHGSLRDAEDLLNEARESLERSGDPAEEIPWYRRLGELATARGDLAAAKAAFDRCLTLVDEGLGLGYAVHGLGAVELIAGDLAEAGRRLGQARDIFEASGNIYARALGERTHGELASLRGERRAAERRFGTALAMYPQTDVLGRAATSRARAELHLRYQERRSAHELSGPVLDDFRRKDLPLGVADTLRLRACIAVEEGRLADAAAELDEAFLIYTQAGCPLGAARAEAVRGRVALASGEPAEAGTVFQTAGEKLDALGATLDGSLVLRWLAAARTASGHPQEAEQILRTALARHTAAGLPVESADTLCDLVEARLRRRETAQARRLLTRAARLCEQADYAVGLRRVEGLRDTI